jgi:hypothetical protein
MSAMPVPPYARSFPSANVPKVLEPDFESDGESDGSGLAERFESLVRKWKAERRPTSSAVKMAAHPAYREIVGLGRDVVPLILAELEREPDHWFLALHELTDANPVPNESRGRLKEMAAAWTAWGKKKGLSW